MTASTLQGALKFESLRMSRNFAPIFFALAFPVMVLCIFGGIYGNKPSSQFNGVGVVDSSVPAYLILVVSVTGLMSFPLGLAEYRDKKILKRFRVTPTGPGTFLFAQGAVNFALSVMGALLLLVVGFAAFGLHQPRHIAESAGVLLLATLAMYAVGALVASAARSERSATAFANLIYFPMIFLSGATIPLAIFPTGMRYISNAIPATYGVKLLQHAWLGTQTNVAVDLIVLFGTFLTAGAISVRVFRWE